MSSVVHTLPLSRIRNPVWHAWTSSWKREIIKAQSCYKLQVHKSWWILCPHVSVPAGMNRAWWSLSPCVSLATGMNWAWWSLRPCVFLLPGVVSEVMKQISSLHFSWVLLVTPVNCMCQFTQKMQLLLINVTIYQLLVKTTEVFWKLQICMPAMSMHRVHCAACFTPWQKLGDPRGSSLPAVAMWSTINIWDMRFHSQQENTAARETKNCPQGGHKAGGWQKNGWGLRLSRTEGWKKSCFPLLCTSLQNASYLRHKKDLVALLKLLLLGVCLVPKATGYGVRGKHALKEQHQE